MSCSYVVGMGEFDHIVAAVRASAFTTACIEMATANDFSRLDKNEAKRQHFVPRFLLRGFAEARNHKEYVFQMETTSRKAPMRVNVLRAASRHRLYTALGDDDKPSNRNEGYLALLEQHAAPALRHLMEEPETLSAGERATIAFLVALQMVRTPIAAEELTQLANAAFQQAASDLCSDRGAFADRRRELAGAATDAEIEEFRRRALDQVRKGQMRVSFSGGDAFSTSFKLAIKHARIVLAFDWTLLRAPSGLITSDRGYALHDPTPPYPWGGPSLLGSASAEMTVPLSDTRCLLIRPGPVHVLSEPAVRNITASHVQTLNLRTYGWAAKHLFGKTQAALDATRVASRRRPADVIRPKPFCEVVLLETDPADDSLAKENARRGWPAYLRNEDGQPRDYIVIPTDAPHPDLRQQADDLAERRARKRAGIGPDTPLNGRITTRPVHPLDLSA